MSQQETFGFHLGLFVHRLKDTCGPAQCPRHSAIKCPEHRGSSERAAPPLTF